ncbi:hypothetical protein AB2M95_15975 [Pseudomonas chlororaphis]|uniref:hypothetical protein n=1 Tax=Pseudomonas chlororaphis TaxID=587753 RepID=UPI002368E425|nr:hypothetical protein [Pseudomonas chlororaphis]WDH55539.1 hypothetical protein PUP75_12345 [Pseudomonas chlororaphis]
MLQPPNESFSLSLTQDEALVLFEFVSRFSDSDQLTIEDQAEQRALWNLCCVLEKHLSLPFEGSYADILQAARERLRDE